MNDQSTTAGLTKNKYDKKFQILYARKAPLSMNYAPFTERGLIGNEFHHPVDLAMEQSITGAAGSTVASPQTPGLAGLTYLPTIDGVSGDAVAIGAQLHGRASVTYEAMARSSDQATAYMKAEELVRKRLFASHASRMEIALLHGRRNIGEISANPTTGASRLLVLTADSWAQGIWTGRIGARLEFWNAAMTARVSLAGNGTDTARVTAVDTASRTVTVAFSVAGDQNLDLTTAPSVFFETNNPNTEMAGLDVWARIASGAPATFFGVNTGFEMWQGNVRSAGDLPLKFATIMDLAADISCYGTLEDGKLVCVLNPITFASLNADQAALRRYDVKYSPGELRNGTEALVFSTAGAEVEILSHACQKQGRAHIFAPAEAFRVGSKDIQFVERGGDKLILESATSPGSEIRSESYMQLFLDTPKHAGVITNIVN